MLAQSPGRAEWLDAHAGAHQHAALDGDAIAAEARRALHSRPRRRALTQRHLALTAARRIPDA